MRHLLAVTLIVSIIGTPTADGIAEPRNGDTHGHTSRGGFKVRVARVHTPGGVPYRHGPSGNSPTPTIVTIDCGSPALVGRPMPITDPACSLARLMCDVQTADQLPKRPVTDLVVITTYPN